MRRRKVRAGQAVVPLHDVVPAGDGRDQQEGTGSGSSQRPDGGEERERTGQRTGLTLRFSLIRK